MSNRFDDLARAVAEPEGIGRRRMLSRALAALGIGVGATVLGGKPAWAAPPPSPPGRGCPPGLTECGGLCRDLTSNSDNCGACGNSCSHDSVCRNGVCVQVTCTCNPVCPTGQTWCNGACIDTESDNSNCGACGTVCAAGTTCSNGACVQSQCTTPADCAQSTAPCLTATCVSGTCGFAPAPAGTACPAGSCNGAGVCVGCTTDADCPAAEVCQNGTCVQECPAGEVLCNGVCVNTSTDVNNCGSCGAACPSGQACVSGTCVATGVCTPGATRPCYSGPAGTANVGICRSGTQICDSTGQWGACLGEVLPQPEVCNGLDDDCDGVVDNGFDLTTDPNNCGSCGNVCFAPNASTGCTNGNCVIVACAPGFIDCDGNFSNGCEVQGTTCP